MARPTAQVLTLLELLQSGGLRTMTELADRLGVDPRTVRRYVDHLIDLDVPVESVRGRHGGYRLAGGYRLPPLMLSDDEAVAVLLGLAAGRSGGLTVANETAAAKIRRVLPSRLAARLDAVRESVAYTAPKTPTPPFATGVLLTIADAVRHRRPVAIRHGGRARTLHPYGLVAHNGRWYVTGLDPDVGEDRTFRLDRIEDARGNPGTFQPPPDVNPTERVLSALATAPYRHEVTLRIRGTVAQIRTRLPAGLAVITSPTSASDHGALPAAPSDRAAPPTSASDRAAPPTSASDRAALSVGSNADPAAAPSVAAGDQWHRVEIRVESLDWLPGVLASLDLPFAVERPEALRDLVRALAGRLAASAGRAIPDADPGKDRPSSTGDASAR